MIMKNSGVAQVFSVFMMIANVPLASDCAAKDQNNNEKW